MGLTRYNYQTRDIPDMVGHRTHEDIIDKWWLMKPTAGSAEQFGYHGDIGSNISLSEQ